MRSKDSSILSHRQEKCQERKRIVRTFLNDSLRANTARQECQHEGPDKSRIEITTRNEHALRFYLAVANVPGENRRAVRLQAIGHVEVPTDTPKKDNAIKTRR
jgi:hypothetical protein